MGPILVTGGAGFIGCNFVRHLAQVQPDRDIVVLDNLTYAASRAAICGIEHAELVVGDIRDRMMVEKLLAERRIDTIVHFAAESHVDRSIAGPDLFFETNIMGTASLLRAARTIWLENGSGIPHRFHHVSTDEVYGSLSDDDPPFSEGSTFAPNSPYAASKAASDHLVRAYHRTYGLAVTTTNCSNNYGPFQHPEKLIPRCVIKLLEGEPMLLFGNGRNKRDWLHVDDHCRAIVACLENGKPGETYAIGGGAELSNLEMACRIEQAVGEAIAGMPDLAGRYASSFRNKGADRAEIVKFVPDRAGHDLRYAIDPAKASREIGFAPSVTFADGLKSTIAWYLANEEWWRPLVAN